MPRLSTLVVLGLLSASVFAQAFLSMRQKSLTFDELTYIPAGWSYVTTGDFRLNREQPPLMKLLAGVGMLAVRPELPVEHESWAAAVETPNVQWEFGRAFFQRAAPEVERVVLSARLPVVFVTILLVVGVYLFARDLYGRTAGFLAATLCAFDPNILAHGRLATTDLGLTCFALWTVWAYRRTTRRPTPGRVAFAGLALGLALLAKFSGLFLLPILLLWTALLPFLPDGIRLPEGRWGRLLEDARANRVAVSFLLGTGVVAVGAFVVSLGYLAPGRADLYLRDFGMVNVHVEPAFRTYLAGTFHEGRVPHYFVAAFLLKTPLALLVLLALRLADRRSHEGESWATRLLLATPVLTWFGIISWKAFQIGIRYVLPVYPFVFVFASGILASPRFRAGWGRMVVAGLAVWFAGSSLAAHPHYLPYMNALAGGPDDAIRWLDDSNVDWGQDLILLREWAEENGVEELKVTPMALYDPALYGVEGERLPPSVTVRDLSRPDPPPGIYAVSVHLLNRARIDPSAAVDPLRDRTPRAVLGHTLHIFDVR